VFVRKEMMFLEMEMFFVCVSGILFSAELLFFSFWRRLTLYSQTQTHLSHDERAFIRIEDNNNNTSTTTRRTYIRTR